MDGARQVTFSINLFSIEEVWSADYSGENQLFDVSFMGYNLFQVEVPGYTEKSEIEEAILRSIFNDRVRGEVEAWLGNE